MFVLDTNVVSELRPGKRNQSPEVRAWAAGLDFRDLYLSAVTLMEVGIGIERKARTDRLQANVLRAWLTAMERRFDGRILPFTARAAGLCAPMHAPDPKDWRDSMIAATAMEHRFTVATRNVTDFEGLGVDTVDPWRA